MARLFCTIASVGYNFFRWRYRIRKSLFMTIMDRMCACNPYFINSRDTRRLLGLSARQKITATMRMLALGVCADVRVL